MIPSTLSVSYQQKLIKCVFEHGKATSLAFLRDTVYKAFICGREEIRTLSVFKCTCYGNNNVFHMCDKRWSETPILQLDPDLRSLFPGGSPDRIRFPAVLHSSSFSEDISLT